MKPNLTRVVFGGIAAGVVINALELLFHRVLLERQWTAAFAALGQETDWLDHLYSIELPCWQFCSGALRVAPPALRSSLEISGAFWHCRMVGVFDNPDDGPHAFGALPQPSPAGDYRNRCD